MGYSGLIYAAIVAAWAAFLVPRWVRRHEEIEQAAETDAARGVRVLRRRTSVVRGGAGHAGTVLHGRVDGLVVGAASPPTGTNDTAADGHGGDQAADSVTAIDAAFAAAARRRRRLLLALVLLFAVGAAGTALASVPAGVPVTFGVLLLMFLVVARRAAVAQSVRRRQAVRHAAAIASAARRDAEYVETEGEDVELTADGKRVAVYEPPAMPEVDPDAWEPVAVPRPTYLDKAVAPALRARSIDLHTSGAWTSGRLDPAGSIELPPQRRHPIAAPAIAESEQAAESHADQGADSASDETAYPEHRRAVGD